ncbi:nuclear transport factor 2 family protein [Anthocerotibacter panamensis]|uniref:nuclear transport factor 2 family protein n=1 Tax=Anthocerotibacter panamensis TaxID=2857077 RepID=UPI001C4045CB|nr:nuclear transport factor 2 family protein [Anthocerotibacter panamensis]
MKHVRWLVLLVLAGPPVAAQPELVQAIGQADEASSHQDLTALMRFYSPDFKNNDGLDKTQLAEALTNLWKNLKTPVYKTEVLEIKPQDSGIALAHTRTQVTGRWQQDHFAFDLTSSLEAESSWKKEGNSWKLISQTVQTERTEIKNGEEPPQTSLNIPATVKAGKNYELEAILTKPLDEYVLGGIKQFKAGATSPEAVDLGGLQSGGFFKKNSVPSLKEDQLVTLGFVQGNGMYFVTQRIKVN